MKRWLVRIFVFLILGAIVNVAVAWGFAMKWPSLHFIQDEKPLEGEVLAAWKQYGGASLPAPLTSKGGRMVNDSPDGGRYHRGFPRQMRHQAFDVLAITLTSIAINDGSGDGVLNDWKVMRVRTGWPVLALQGGSVWSRTEQSYNVTDGLAVQPAMVQPGVKENTLLPLRPIWPGFAINTVFYATVLWLLFAAPFALRRWRRIKRGLCPKCAYPVGTSDVCTECGARVRQP